jgi:hypothetical protein
VAGRLRRAWGGLPRWARWVLAAYLIGFAQGTAAHIRDLVRGGIHAYSALPQAWIQVFFVGLVVLDPLVVALAGFVRREGIWLAAGVMALDVTANWIGNWPSLHEDPARLLGPVGLAPITLFGVFVLVTALPMLRVMKADSSGSTTWGPG